MPNKTNGYQRKAQATIGSTTGTAAQSAVVVSSAAWGHEGGNGITVEMVNRPGANLPLAVEVDGKATCACCSPRTRRARSASTAAQVAAAIEAGSSGLIDRAHPYRTNAGTGIVPATTAPVVLTDFLDQKRTGAPAGEVPRGPYTIRALRIGKHRDGSKPGVLIQASDHAREWVPMTITLETAERLVAQLRRTTRRRKDIIENTDIFLIPVEQPGRRELLVLQLRVPAPEHDQPLPGRGRRPGPPQRVGRGPQPQLPRRVGLRRLLRRVDELHQRHVPGPGQAVRAGEQELDLARRDVPQHQVHDVRALQRRPAVLAAGRVHRERPHHDAAAAARPRVVLLAVGQPHPLAGARDRRQTVVTPENVGGSSDVLYSSAGNVREDMYFNYGIFAFGWEVGGSVYNPATGNFQGGSFQPPWVGQADLVSGHSETLEYSNGIIEMFRIAADWGRDKTPGDVLADAGRASVRLADRREVRDQRAGDRSTTRRTARAPTLQSPRYKQTEFREPGEELWVEQTTTFKWFSVDAAGNVEPAGYDPNNPATADNYRIDTIKIGEEGGVGGTVPATLSLALGTAATFPSFVPGVAREYRRRRRPTSSPPPATPRCPSRRPAT